MNTPEKTSAIISITDLTSSIRCFLERYKKNSDDNIIYKILDELLSDFFFPTQAVGHIGNTLQFVYGLGLPHTTAYPEVEYMYNQLLFLIDATRLSLNKDYLDKVKYDVLSLDRLLLSYDESAPIVNYTF